MSGETCSSRPPRWQAAGQALLGESGRPASGRQLSRAKATKEPKPKAYKAPAEIEANHTTQPTPNAASTERTFLANVYVPPDCGNRDDSSAKLMAVSRAIRPFNAKATSALGPVATNATPARARTPPPTIAPTPILVAPKRPIDRLDSVANVMRKL